ncbi:MAG: sugar ABC transporter substrate-binding protein [Anaerolineae bacterium]|nr:sugar ABC transporter substrate-binding protein [Anaerolineae bacterium]
MVRRLTLLIAVAALVLPLGLIHAAPLVTLNVFWMYTRDEAMSGLLNRFARDFEAANPNISINLTIIDWADGHDAIKKAFTDGKAPDISVIGSRWVPEFVSLGYIEPLDKYMSLDFRARFIPTLINNGAMYQNRIFGLPVATSVRALYYNKDIFKAADIQKIPQTWDDLLAAGKAINALNQGIYGFGLQGGGGLETNTYFYYFVWGNGGNLYNASLTASALNEPASVKALEFLQRMVQENATQPDPTSKAFERRRNLEDMFQAGKLGMVISGPWLGLRLRQEAPGVNYGIVPIPYRAMPSTYGVIDALVMTSASQHKTEAWSFLTFLYDEQRRLEYTRLAGVLPELDAVAKRTEFTQDPDYAIFLSLLPIARFEPLHNQSEQIAQTVINAIRPVYQGTVSPQAALDGASQTINKMLAVSVAGW